MTRQATAQAVAFGVLGPVEAVSDRGPVPLKGPRQRAVLARLLIARGRVVPVDRLVDDLWDVPPDGAVAAIRTFVSDLRRALEPDRLPREQARLLVTAPPGYVLRAAPDGVDAWRFEAMVGESARLLTAGQGTEALAGLDKALALWRGPAYAEVAGEIWARAEIDRLDELRLLAVERRAEALLLLGRATDAAFELQAHTQDQPLREDAWQLLATALYRSGRQGEALAALRRVRHTLATELGLDPGPRLRQLEADILAQAPHLRPATAQPPAQPATPSVPTPTTDDLPAGPRDRPDPALVSGDEQRPFVGRAEELAHLEQVAATVVRHARPTLALVSGDAGTGKTALAEALTGRLAAVGWTTAWGRSPEYDGAAIAGPWTQIIDALTGPVSGPAREQPGRGDAANAPPAAGDPAVSRFRLRHAALSRLATVAEQRPLLLVVDDLHRADESTLDLLTALVAQPAPVNGPVLVVGTYRATEITPELTAALARSARTEPVRVYLGGLSETATAELARAVARQPLDAPTAHLIHRRSGGNPFFVRELARLVAAEGAVAVQEVPAGVRDVIRHRLSRLPGAARTVLRQAAVIGRDIDPDVLVGLVGDEATMLDALDSALQAGFLTEQAPGGQPRFTHILVRDTLYGDLSALRRAHWHAAVAEAIERLHPQDVAALAHHFQHAESRATAPRAARYAHAAAERAEHRSNPHEAVRLWRQAITAHDRADRRDVPGRLAAVMGLGRALAVTGQLGEARRLRAEAITTVERLDDPQLTANVIAAFGVPAIWTRNDDEHLSAQVVRAAEHALAGLGEDQLAHRSRLLSTVALELRGTTTDRGRRAAREATAIARQTADPALLAFALNARFMHTFQRPGLADARARIGTELVDLAARQKLVTFEVLGHLILLQAHGALGELTTADAHAEAADRLADRYGLPSVSVFTRWYAALRLAVDGRLAEAEAGYRAANAQLVGGGMPGMAEGLLPLALLSLSLQTSAPSLQTSAPLTEWENWNWGPYEPWTRPLLLLGADRRGEAAAALSRVPESPHDLLWEVRLCLVGRAALALDDRPTMRYVHTRLLPAANELAGAGSGVLTLGPVARHLDDLAAALRR
ncbi:BTAD domain-containing putative transcriptional regulator [Plantactinospora solaniradicis]|uniref:BTAD domain-containing putative transcriptional regulator n=1 Tax=Plantactinospora solaniradicis TaxID=1723736 RepID=A0ABW1KDI5_9ACTN